MSKQYISSIPHGNVIEGINCVFGIVGRQYEFTRYSEFHITLAYWDRGQPVDAVNRFRLATDSMRELAKFKVSHYELWDTLIVALLEPCDVISLALVNEIKALREATRAQHSDKVKLHITIGKVTEKRVGQMIVESINSALAHGLCVGKQVTKIFDILG